MAKIVIEQYSSIGGDYAKDGAPVNNLKALVETVVDATTSVTPETITLHPNAQFVTITGDVDHRVSYGSDTTSTKYATILAGQFRDFAVDPSDVIYYRTEA